MPPVDSADNVENVVVPDSGEISHESRAKADDDARTVRRSKVRVLQRSRSDLLI